MEKGSAPTDYYLDVTPNALAEIPSEGTTSTFTVNSNTTWQVFGETDWCHLTGSTSTTGNGSVTLTVDANTNTEPRFTTISFYSKDAEPVYINVTQKGYEGSEPDQGDNGTPTLARRKKD